MTTLYIEPTDEIQAINDAIQATSPGQNIIFEPGEYILDRSLHFIGGRAYVAREAIFRCIPDFDGSAIRLVDRPDSEKSRLEKALWNKPILLKIVAWVCRLLHIPFDSGTLITGFIIVSGNYQDTDFHTDSYDN